MLEMLVPTPKQARPGAAVVAPVPGRIIGRVLRESPAPAVFVKLHRRVWSDWVPLSVARLTDPTGRPDHEICGTL
jgi:hypothetical protein